MITVWTVSVAFALVFILSVPVILSGKGDNLIATDESKHLFVLKRLRILMAFISFSAALFCIAIPFMIKGNDDMIIFIATVVFASIVLSITLLTKIWAKKK